MFDVSLRDSLIAGARSAPELIARARSEGDPKLAEALTGKALLAARSPYGVVATYIITWLAAKYGLGWDANIVALVAGAAVYVAALLFRKITSAPIVGIVRVPPPALAMLALCAGLSVTGCTAADKALGKAGLPASTIATIDWTAARAGQLFCTTPSGQWFAVLGANVLGAAPDAVAKACAAAAQATAVGLTLTPAMPEPGTVAKVAQVTERVLTALNDSKPGG